MSDTAPHANHPHAYQLVESVVIAALLSAAAVACLHAAYVSDPDIWWHLRTGQWILAHHAIPRVDHYTAFAAGRAWHPYSWLFEVCAYLCFHRFGLAGILVCTAALMAAISTAIYHTVRRLQPDFLIGVIITLVASMSLMRMATPRPWLFTILFSAIQLDILFHARKTGRWRELLWLPFIYILWANVHIEFIDGLFMLGTAFIEALLAFRWPAVRTRLNPSVVIAISIACILSTLVNPFGWEVYRIGYGLASQSAVKYISEMGAMPFRSPADYMVLLLALAAAVTLGYARRFQFFESLLLLFAVVVTFRSQRDMWVVIIVAAAILAQGIPAAESRRLRLRGFTLPVIAVVLVCIVFVSARVLDINNARLSKKLALTMPVRAVQIIRQNGYRGPLYNTYGWGGYLIWNLRMPVSIDGRALMDGNQRMTNSYRTWRGLPGWQSNPTLSTAGLVIGPADSALAQLLRLDPHFELAYQDKIAAVFIARRLHEEPGKP